jgi:bifunctional DNA-binding transcriptional regulator/antitoxin component of YhaV-PrlF toxin-antitoxin module
MAILPMPDGASSARLNALRFSEPIELVAEKMARHCFSKGSILVPDKVTIKPMTQGGKKESFAAAVIRTKQEISEKFDLPGAGFSVIVKSGDACFLRRLKDDTHETIETVVAAARSNPDVFVRLALQLHLIGMAAHGLDDIVFDARFGTDVYFDAQNAARSRKFLNLAQVQFLYIKKHNIIVTLVRAKCFIRRDNLPDSRPHQMRHAATDDNGTVPLHRVDSRGYVEVDARKMKLDGINLTITKFRHSRLYFLNLLTEFIAAACQSAGVQFEQEIFRASHRVADGYLSLRAIARLKHPLCLVNGLDQPLPEHIKLYIVRVWEEKYGLYGTKKAGFDPVRTIFVEKADVDWSKALDPNLNYLFISQCASDENSCVLDDGAGGLEMTPYNAYAMLSAGASSTFDIHTMAKYRHLIGANTLTASLQGVNLTLNDFSAKTDVPNCQDPSGYRRV